MSAAGTACPCLRSAARAGALRRVARLGGAAFSSRRGGDFDLRARPRAAPPRRTVSSAAAAAATRPRSARWPPSDARAARRRSSASTAPTVSSPAPQGRRKQRPDALPARSADDDARAARGVRGTGRQQALPPARRRDARVPRYRSSTGGAASSGVTATCRRRHQRPTLTRLVQTTSGTANANGANSGATRQASAVCSVDATQASAASASRLTPPMRRTASRQPSALAFRAGDFHSSFRPVSAPSTNIAVRHHAHRRLQHRQQRFEHRAADQLRRAAVAALLAARDDQRDAEHARHQQHRQRQQPQRSAAPGSSRVPRRQRVAGRARRSRSHNGDARYDIAPVANIARCTDAQAGLGDQAQVLQVALAPAAVALQLVEQVRRLLLVAAVEVGRQPHLLARAAHQRGFDEIVRQDLAGQAAAAGHRRQRAMAHERLDAQDRVVAPVVRFAELPVGQPEREQPAA